MPAGMGDQVNAPYILSRLVSGIAAVMLIGALLLPNSASPNAVPTPATPAEVAGSATLYAINLESTLAPVDLAHLQPPAGFENQHFYTTDVEKDGKLLHRLSLGYFDDKRSAAAAARSLRKEYPDVGVSKDSDIVAAVDESVTVSDTGLPTAAAVPQPKVAPVERRPKANPGRVHTAAAVGQPVDEGKRDEEQEIEFDFDDPPNTRYQITPYLSVGADLEFDFELEHNLDLDQDENEDDKAVIDPQFSIALSYDPNDRFRAFGELELSREIFVDQPDQLRDRQTRLIVKRAYVTLRELLPGVTAQLGRQRIEDELEWFYDETLDAARLFFRDGRYGAEDKAMENRK